MKKALYVGVLIAAIILAFVVGIIVSSSNSKDSVVGVYQTDSWNGKPGTLVLYKDGTCQYPSGGNATWVLDGDAIHITLEKNTTMQDGGTKSITIYFSKSSKTEDTAISSSDLTMTEDERNAICQSILKLDNIESVYYVEETQLFKITLSTAEKDNKTSKELSKIEGVKIVELTPDTEVSTTEHEAKIMENGLILHEQFFEKVSN